MATREELEKLLDTNKNVQAALRLVSKAEDTARYPDPYRVGFGGKDIADLSTHPNVRVPFTQTDGKQNFSTAAGAYQFIKPTWDEEASELNLTGFTPREQDLAALNRIRKRGALEDVLAGRFDKAVGKLGNEWASLPSSNYPQPKRSPGFIEQALNTVIPAAEAAPVSNIDLSRVQWDEPAAATKTAPSIDLSKVQWDDAPAADPRGLRVDMNQQDAQRMQAAAAPQERSLIDRIGRQVGLTARAGVTGLTGLPQMGTNAVIGGLNSLFGTNIPKADVNATLSAIGLPEPENTVERVAQDAAGAMAGAGGVAGLAQSAVNPLATTLGQRFASLLSSQPAMQVASAATGGASSGIARESGASPLGQLAAGLVGGMAPSLAMYGGAAATRGLLRGGEEGRQTVANNLEAFQRAGTSPTVGQVTERPVLQGLETGLSQTPGATGRMLSTARNQADDIGETVGGIVQRLSPNAGAVEAGESVAKGLQGFKAGVREQQANLYGKLDEYIPQNAPVRVDRTKEALAALNSDIEGAPALSAMFKNGRIQGIENALQSDIKSGATAYGAQASRKTMEMPYESIKKLRTLVGNEIDNATFVSDVPRDKWRALYAALSEDLGEAAKKAGPEAADAWRAANSFSRQMMTRIDDLSVVGGKDTPEQVFNAAMMGSRDGDTILSRVVNSIPKDNRKDLAAAVIQKMGRPAPGVQNEAGDAFSTSSFLTNWNKLSPKAQQTLFGRTGDKNLLSELANLASVSSNIKEGSRYLANPSGSGAAIGRLLMGSGLAGSAFTGNVPALAGIAGTAATANLLARLLTNPENVARLAQRTQLSVPGITGGLQGLIPRQ